ncbi:MAG: hypothetical protein PHN49_04905 [Candidatus Omnitrophica bacterium]|nr:hypothetical protein [Candidatus Omnitrophota bacterium]MDD5670960.1 hypothetical protein [Candidatus Omnitrophota bacterium]
MRQNFQRDKRRKEELRKKKQEEKRNKRLQKRAQDALPGQESSGVPTETVEQNPPSIT